MRSSDNKYHKKNTASGGPRRSRKQKKSKRAVWIRAVMIVCCVFAVLALSACIAYDAILNYYVGLVDRPDGDLPQSVFDPNSSVSTDKTPDPSPDVPDEPVVIPEKGVRDETYLLNILLIGVDARHNEPCRSDSMLLISLNTQTGKIVASSLLRDMCVSIEGHYTQDKLNHAHAYGGTDLLLSTLKENFGIDISYYVKVNFYDFMEIVDLMGGLEMEVTASEVRVMNTYYIPELNSLLGEPAGTDTLPLRTDTYFLNGKQVLAYSRNRYTTNEIGYGDWARSGRQRKVLSALADKAKTQNVLQLHTLLVSLLPKVTTNMPSELLKALVNNLPTYLSYEVVQTAIPLAGTYKTQRIRGMDMMVTDIETNMQHIHNLVYYGVSEPQ